jgi:quercetin dioxygenase-like cupin family protein
MQLSPKGDTQSTAAIRSSSRYYSRQQNSGVPVLDQIETAKILHNVRPGRHGGRKGKDEKNYEVRRLKKVGTATIDFMKLDTHKAYPSHRHHYSDSKIYITQGLGFLVLRKGNQHPKDEGWHSYKPGDMFYVTPDTFHGFFTNSETHFVSINDPEILNQETGDVDIEFESDGPTCQKKSLLPAAAPPRRHRKSTGLGRRPYRALNVRSHPARLHSEISLDSRVKTYYLYNMSSRLVNVRLDADRLRKVQTLRARGMALSDVVREAIDERFAALRRSESMPDVRTVVRRIFEQYPDPPGLPSRDYDVDDRPAARVAILRKLRSVPR